MKKPTPDETYRAVRNKLRRYTLNSIVHIALQLLDRRFSNIDEEMKSSPWLILTMVRMALEDKMVGQVGEEISAADFLELQNRLWNMGILFNQRTPVNLHRFIRSFAYVQIEFQRPETFEFARWPAILARLPTDHPVRRRFEISTDLSPENFADLVWGVYTAVLQHEQPLNPNYFVALRSSYGDKIDVLLGLLSKDVTSLRKQLSENPVHGRPPTHVLVEAPVFRRFPLLRTANNQFFSWHPKVFARGIEEFVHHHLSGGGGDYATSFGDVFEDYVVNLAKGTGLQSLDESSFKQTYGSDKRAVEIILREGASNILIEAKFGLYQDEYMTLDDAGYMQAKLGKLRQGVAQAVDVSRRLSEASESSLWSVRDQDYLLLVTNRQLYMPTGRQLEYMSSENPNDIDDRVRLKVSDKLSIDNIFILSLDEFERFMVSASNREISITETLALLSERVSDPKNLSLLASQMLAEHGPMLNLGPVVLEEVSASMARLHDVFGQEYDPTTEPWYAG